MSLAELMKGRVSSGVGMPAAPAVAAVSPTVRGRKTLEDGIHYDLPADDYFDDPAETPSLSSSIAKRICADSPLHAWTAHPRLNPGFERRDTVAFDRGHVAHALLLQGVERAHVCCDSAGVPFSDWRKGEAKATREAVRAQGRIPMLQDQYDEVLAMVAAANTQLDRHRGKPRLFSKGRSEVTLVWTDDGIRCRARLDWLSDSQAFIDDLKTTGKSANPDTIARMATGDGWDIQAAFYLRGLEVLTGKKAAFRFACVEAELPYALSVLRPSSGLLLIGEKKRLYALEVWRRCLETGEWPGYSTTVEEIPLTECEEQTWLAKEERAAQEAHHG